MKNFDDAILEAGWRNLDSQYNRFKDIDAKAIGIITITGILMIFLSKPEEVYNCNLSSVLFVLTAIAFLATIFLCVLVIRTRKASVLSTNYLIKYLENENLERQIGGIIGTIAEVEDDLMQVCNTKAEQLTLAVYFLGLSIILMIFYYLSIFL